MRAAAAPLCGGLLLGALVGGRRAVVREPPLRRLGARYAAAGSPAAHADPDRAAWAALDDGRDPTADPPPTPRAGPLSRPNPRGAGAAVPRPCAGRS